MSKTKEDTYNEIRREVGRDPKYSVGHNFTKNDLLDTADHLDADYEDGATNAELRASIMNTIGKENIDPVDVRDGFDELQRRDLHDHIVSDGD